MAKIVKVSIKNFRGISNCKFNINYDKNFICLVGRGDNGKTTILEAISHVLSPSWNLTFYDTDFLNCNINESIEIELILVDINDKLLSDSKYGLYQQGYNRESGEIFDKITADKDMIPALTVRLTVNSDLEPKWEVVNGRENDNKDITAKDRANLNCFMVADYVDRHFSWGRNTPLPALLKMHDIENNSDNNDFILDAMRSAKQQIDDNTNTTDSFSEVNDILKANVAELGLDVSQTTTSIDFRDIMLKESKLCLHDDNIPFRLKGKGSKRLISIAIQMALVDQGGIALIDEIEQGLEPDRIKLLARSLKEKDCGQIFITTHSRDVITEIDADNINVVHNDDGNVSCNQLKSMNQNTLQGVVRACPEAFFAKKIIVCEGATEVGICRALDKYRKRKNKKLMALRDCAYIDGGGNSFVVRSKEIKNAGFEVLIFCDSDVTNINDQKEGLESNGIVIADCSDDYSIEQQVFNDLSLEGIIALIEYVKIAHNKDNNSIRQSVEAKYKDIHTSKLPKNWLTSLDSNVRQALAGASAKPQKDKKEDQSSGKKDWFKSVTHGEKLGEIILNHIDIEDDTSHLEKMFNKISKWIGD